MVKTAKLNNGYEITEDGEQKQVTFWGDGMVWAGYLIVPLVYGLVVLFLASPVWHLALLVGTALTYVLYLMFQKQSFTLTQHGLIKKGVEYEWKNIAEVILDNPVNKSVSVTGQPGLIVGGTGILGASVAAASIGANLATDALTHMNVAILSGAAKRRYRVRIRHGSSVVTVARNLRREKASAIFDLLTES